MSSPSRVKTIALTHNEEYLSVAIYNPLTYWVRLSQTQNQRLEFLQTESFAIMIYTTKPGDCIDRVTSQSGEDFISRNRIHHEDVLTVSVMNVSENIGPQKRPITCYQGSVATFEGRGQGTRQVVCKTCVGIKRPG